MKKLPAFLLLATTIVIGTAGCAERTLPPQTEPPTAGNPTATPDPAPPAPPTPPTPPTPPMPPADDSSANRSSGY